jgi:hypothetical protein
MGKEIVLQRLKNLLSNKTDLEKSGPRSEKGRQWLADCVAALNQADPKAANQFSHLTQYVFMNLSSVTLVPIWENMLFILHQTISILEISEPQKEEKIYAPGDQYALYKDLKDIIANAKSEVFIIDPYANEEIFDLYLEKVDLRVNIRFFTKDPSIPLKVVISKFANKPNVNFQAKSSPNIHDRVIFIDSTYCWVLGQSIKDAASKKPTYLIPVDSLVDMKNLYEDLWIKGITIK